MDSLPIQLGNSGVQSPPVKLGLAGLVTMPLGGLTPGSSNPLEASIAATTQRLEAMQGGYAQTVYSPITKARRYDDPVLGYNPYRTDQEDLYARNQSALSSFGRGLGRFAVTTLTKTGSGLGYIGAGLLNTFSGNEGGTFEDRLTNWVAHTGDNAFSAQFNKWEDDVKNDWMPIYQEAKDRNKGFFSRALTDLNFWTEDFSDGAAFMASAMLPGMVLSKLGLGVRTVRGLAALKSLNMTDEAALAYKESLKAAAALGNNYEAMSKIPQVAKWISNAKLARNMDVGLQTVLSVVSESMFEANDSKQKVMQDLEGKINPATGIEYTQKELKERGAKAAQGTFKGNLLALSLSNLWEANLIFKRLPSTSAAAGESAILGKSLFGPASAAKVNKFAKFGKNAAEGIAAEGLWEENIQLAISRFNESTNDPNVQNKRYRGSIFDNYVQGTLGALSGEDQEAAISIGMGGILGGIVGGVMSTHEDLQRDKVVRGKIQTFNNIAQSFKNFSDIYEKEEYDTKDEAGNDIKQTRLKLDEHGLPIKNKEKLQAFINGNVERARLSELINKAEATGNKSMVDMLENELFSQFALAHFELGKGDVLLEKLQNIQNISDEDLSMLGFDPTQRTQAGQKVQELASRAKNLQELYDDIQRNVITEDQSIEEARKNKLFELGYRQQFLADQLQKSEANFAVYEPIDKLNAAVRAARQRFLGLKALQQGKEIKGEKVNNELLQEASEDIKTAEIELNDYVKNNAEILEGFKRDEEGYIKYNKTDPYIHRNFLRNKLRTEELEKNEGIRLALKETVNRFDRIAHPITGEKYFKDFITPKNNITLTPLGTLRDEISKGADDKHLAEKFRILAEKPRFDPLTEAVPEILDSRIPFIDRLQNLLSLDNDLAAEIYDAFRTEIDDFIEKTQRAAEEKLAKQQASEEFLSDDDLITELNDEQDTQDGDADDFPTDNTTTERQFISTRKKKHISELFRSTLVLDEHGLKGIESGRRLNRYLDRLPNSANARRAMLVTVNNQKALGLEGLIEFHVGDKNIDLKDPQTTPYMVVFGEVDKKGNFHFVDEFGNRLGKVKTKVKDFDKLVYGILPTNSLYWSAAYGGEARYQSATRKKGETIEITSESEAKRYADAWAAGRTEIFNQLVGDTTRLFTYGISMGHPQLDAIMEAIIKEQEGEEEKEKIYPTNSVVGTLTTQEVLDKPERVIEISTTGFIDYNGQSVPVPVGRPFFKNENNLIYLNNRKLTRKDGLLIFDIIKQMAANKSLQGPLSKYLQSILYFSSPDNNKAPSPHQIWVEDGMLHLGPLVMEFRVDDIQDNKDEIINHISTAIFHNIKNKNLTTDFHNPYDEIIGLDADGGAIVRRWKTYQHYLLSPKYVLDSADETGDNGKDRPKEEIVLTTSVRPKKDENDINVEGRYAILSGGMDSEFIKVKGEEYIAPLPTPNINKRAPKREKIKDEVTLREKYKVKVNRIGENEYEVVPDDLFITALHRIKETQDFQAVKKLMPDNTDDQVAAAILQKYLNDYVAGKEIKEEVKKQEEEIKKQEDPEIKALKKEIKAAKASDTPLTDAEKKVREEEENAGKNKEKRKGRDESQYRRVVNDATRSAKSLDQEESWFRGVLPQVSYARMKNVILTTDGGLAYGRFYDAAVEIWENAEVGTTYHEAFEAIWKLFINPRERDMLSKEFRNREGSFTDRVTGQKIKYSEATDQQMKEEMAEEFRDYKLYDKKPKESKSKSNLLLKIFNELIKFIKHVIYGDATSINKVFDRLNKGYYASRPVNINDKSKDEYSRIKGLSSRSQQDLIIGMTQYIVKDMYANNRSVVEFDEGIGDVEKTYEMVYGKLKDEFEDFQRYDFEDAVDSIKNDARLSEYQKGEALNSLRQQRASVLEAWNVIKNNWDSIKQLNNEYLATYKIVIKQKLVNEDELEDVLAATDDNRNGREYEIDHLKYDGKKNAPASIKLLIGTISESLFDENGNLKAKKNSLGLDEKSHFGKTFNQLLENIASFNAPQEKWEKLKELAEKYPNFKRLTNRLLKNNPTVDDMKLLIKFFSVFSKQKPIAVALFENEDGTVTFGNIGLQNEIDAVSQSWFDSLKFKALKKQSSLISINKNGYFVINQNELAKLSIVKKEDKVNFLKELGVEFDEKDINALSPEDSVIFNASIQSVFSTLKRKEAAANIKALDIEGAIRKIAEIVIIAKGDNLESTQFNIEGERVQKHIQGNFISTVLNDINNAKTFKELKRRLPYLGTDKFARGSQWLSEMFDEQGQKKPRKKLSIKYVQGTVNKRDNKATPTEKLSSVKRLMQEINMNLNGMYYILVPADSKTEWMIDSGNFITMDEFQNNIVWNKINDRFWEYYQTEVALKKLRLTADIVGGKDLNLTKEQFASKLKIFLDDRVREQYDFLADYNLTDGRGIDTDFIRSHFPEDMTEAKMKQLLTYRTINYMVANTEIMKLFFGDPIEYSDPLKRFKSFESPRETSFHSDEAINTQLDREFNKVGDVMINDQVPGWTKYSDDMNTVVINDVYSVSPLVKTLQELGLSKKEMSKFRAYLSNNETDGQSWASLPQYREILQKSGYRWTNKHEQLYQYLMAKDRLMMEEDGLFNYTTAGVDALKKADQELVAKGRPKVGNDIFYAVLKPIGTGRFATSNDPFLDKTSLLPMHYGLVRGTTMATHYNKMLKQQISYMIVASGRKVGVTVANDVYNKEGKPNAEPFKAIKKVPFKYYGIQVETMNKKDSQTRGSQFTKLALVNLFDGGVPIDYDGEKDWFQMTVKERSEYRPKNKKGGETIYNLVKKNIALLNEMTDAGYKNLLHKFGIEDTGTQFKITDKSKLVKLLRDELFTREVEDNIKDAISVTDTGELSVPFEAIPKYRQIKSILFSYVDKLIAQPKLNGGPKVQVSSAMLESVRQTEDGQLVSSALKFYNPTIKDGKIVAVEKMEVMLPCWFRNKLKGTKYKNMSDDELIKHLNADLLNGIGFRIPTQELNSVESFVIKGFLPEEFGDTVVVPAELTTKAGSDFDIDKLNTYLKNIYIDAATGEIKEIPFFGLPINEEDRRRKRNDAFAFFTFKVHNNLQEEELSDLEDEYDDTDEQDKFNRFYLESLENEYFKSLDKLITLPENAFRLLTPNTSDDLKSERDRLKKLLGDKETRSFTQSILNPMYMSTRRHEFIVGKDGVGIAAVAQTNNAINQLSRIFIDPSKRENLDDAERKFLGDMIVRLPHNTIDVPTKEGGTKKYITLSKKLDAAGRVISDKISQYINGFVDIAKDTFVVELGATPNTAGTFLFLEKIGVPSNIVIEFMNQPIIRELHKIMASKGDTWILETGFGSSGFGASIDEAMEMFPTDPGQQEPDVIDIDHLSHNISHFYANNKRFSSSKNAEQQLILKEFLKYTQMASQLFELVQGTNYDTAKFSDSNLLYKKSYGENIARHETIFNSVDKLLESTHIGGIRNYIKKASEAIGTTILKLENPIVKAKLGQIFDVFLKRKVNQQDFLKLANQVELDYINYTIFTDKNLSNEIKTLALGIEGSVAGRLAWIKDHKILPDNLILKVLKPKIEGKTTDVQNIALITNATDIFTSNLYTDALRELKENASTRDLYGDLVKMAFIQSGISNSPIAFTNLIPHEDFAEFILPTVNKLENPNNLDEYISSGAFFRNNWGNSDAVPLQKDAVNAKNESKLYYKSIWMNKFLESKGLPTNFPILKMWNKNRKGASPYIKTTRITINPLTNKPYTRPEINVLAKRGDFSWMETILARRVDYPGGKPLEVPYNDKYPDGAKHFIYVPVNAWGAGMKAKEFYNKPTKSVIEKNVYVPQLELDFNEVILAKEYKEPPPPPRPKGSISPAIVNNMQKNIVAALPIVIKETAKKWLTKELFKAQQATQYIGEGSPTSSTTVYKALYDDYRAANTGKYFSHDLIWVSSNGKRPGRVNPMSGDRVTGVYRNIDKAIAAGASFIMDTAAHIEATKSYNIGEIQLAEYLQSKGYVRDDKTGIWTPGNSTQQQAPISNKAVVDKTMSWGEIKTLPVYSDKGVNVMRKQGTHEHFGNPWTASGIPGLIQMPSIQEAVTAYKSWLEGKIKHNPEQLNWVLEQINKGKLDRQKLLYMKDKGEYYSHADALRDFVNNRASKLPDLGLNPDKPSNCG